MVLKLLKMFLLKEEKEPVHHQLVCYIRYVKYMLVYFWECLHPCLTGCKRKRIEESKWPSVFLCVLYWSGIVSFYGFHEYA